MQAEEGGKKGAPAKVRKRGSFLEDLASALTWSRLRRPPPAQDHTPVCAGRGVRSDPQGTARRLDGTRGADPFLRKLCPEEQALNGKESEAADFQNP